MLKNHPLRLLTVLAVVGMLTLWSSAQTKPKPAPKQNPNSTVAASEDATEKRSGINDTIDIVEGPRVESVSKNSAVLEWKTNKEAANRVQYGTNQNSLTQHAYEPGGSREHKVTLKNLRAGTTYFYAIENRSGKQRYDGQFQTKQ
jgi:Purple acid Phosphatase, N-terminal domain